VVFIYFFVYTFDFLKEITALKVKKIQAMLFKEKLSFIKAFKNGFPYCGPTLPPGAVNLRNLILDHVKNILCKFQFF
jgi:hypothetical protein